MRKNAAPRRELTPDPVYDSVLVTQFVNKILQRGKRATAERIMTLITGLNRDLGVTFVMVTHNQALTAYAGRTAHLVDGRLDA